MAHVRGEGSRGGAWSTATIVGYTMLTNLASFEAFGVAELLFISRVGNSNSTFLNLILTTGL